MNSLLLVLILFFSAEPKHVWDDPVFDQVISISSFDSALMQEALFHATNLVRQKNNRSALVYQMPLEQAAQSHSQVMAKNLKLDHREKSKRRKNPSLRVSEAGGEFETVGENILYLPIHQFSFLHQNYLVEDEMVTTETGKEIPLHTYRSWAELALQEWMDSPGHRKNILKESYLYLGAGSSLPVYHKNLPYLYATQVFAGN